MRYSGRFDLERQLSSVVNAAMCRERDDAGVVRRAHVQRGPAGAVRRQHGRTRSVRPRAERLRLGVALQRRAVAPASTRAVPATDTRALPLHRGTGRGRPLQSSVQRRTLRGHGLRVTSPRTCHVTPLSAVRGLAVHGQILSRETI